MQVWLSGPGNTYVSVIPAPRDRSRRVTSSKLVDPVLKNSTRQSKQTRAWLSPTFSMNRERHRQWPRAPVRLDGQESRRCRRLLREEPEKGSYHHPLQVGPFCGSNTPSSLMLFIWVLPCFVFVRLAKGLPTLLTFS